MLLFVRFDEACAGGEYGRKGEEQASHNGAVELCNHSGGNADRSSEDKADDPLVQLDSLDGGDASPDEHGGYRKTSQKAKETANQMGMRETVAVRGRILNRQRRAAVAAA